MTSGARLTGWPLAAQSALLLVLTMAFVVGLEAMRLPAALLLGPMLAAIFVATQGGRLQLPDWLFQIGQGVVACMIARSMTPALLARVAADWPVVLASILAVILLSNGLGVILARRGVLPGTTAIWGATPGASTVMILLAEAYGGDMRLVAFMQYMRVILVAAAASTVARLATGPHAATAVAQGMGWLVAPRWDAMAATLAIAVVLALVGPRLRIPAGSLLLPLGVAALLQDSAGFVIELPPAELALSYAVIGWSVGLRFSRDILQAAMKALPVLVGATLLLILLCGCVAAVLVMALGIDPLTAYLATSPGGADSVAIIAASSKVDIPFVMAMQCARFVLLVVAGPAFARFAAARLIPPAARPA